MNDWLSRVKSRCGSLISLHFQNPKVTCALNATMPATLPLCRKCGMPHLMASSICGQALWKRTRSFFKMGCVNGAARAM